MFFCCWWWLRLDLPEVGKQSSCRWRCISLSLVHLGALDVKKFWNISKPFGFKLRIHPLKNPYHSQWTNQTLLPVKTDNLMIGQFYFSPLVYTYLMPVSQYVLIQALNSTKIKHLQLTHIIANGENCMQSVLLTVKWVVWNNLTPAIK